MAGFPTKFIPGKKIPKTVVNAATYDVVKMRQVLLVTYTATGPVTSLTLPSSLCKEGNWLIVKDAVGLAGTNNITIDTEGSEKIDGQDTLVINTNYDWTLLYCDGSNWYVIG